MLIKLATRPLFLLA